MKKFWPIPVVAVVAAGALYLTLLAIAPAATYDDDPWSRPLQASGLKVQFRSVTDERGTFMVLERRDLIRQPEFAGTVVRDYIIEGFKAQVVTFPQGASLQKMAPDGERRNWKPDKDKSRAYHVCRSGRNLLVLSTVRPWLLKRERMPDALADRIFKSFKSAVERNENPKD